jgi:hypothetical protein
MPRKRSSILDTPKNLKKRIDDLNHPDIIRTKTNVFKQPERPTISDFLGYSVYAEDPSIIGTAEEGFYAANKSIAYNKAINAGNIEYARYLAGNKNIFGDQPTDDDIQKIREKATYDSLFAAQKQQAQDRQIAFMNHYKILNATAATTVPLNPINPNFPNAPAVSGPIMHNATGVFLDANRIEDEAKFKREEKEGENKIPLPPLPDSTNYGLNVGQVKPSKFSLVDLDAALESKRYQARESDFQKELKLTIERRKSENLLVTDKTKLATSYGRVEEKYGSQEDQKEKEQKTAQSDYIDQFVSQASYKNLPNVNYVDANRAEDSLTYQKTHVDVQPPGESLISKAIYLKDKLHEINKARENLNKLTQINNRISELGKNREQLGQNEIADVRQFDENERKYAHLNTNIANAIAKEEIKERNENDKEVALQTEKDLIEQGSYALPPSLPSIGPKKVSYVRPIDNDRNNRQILEELGTKPPKLPSKPPVRVVYERAKEMTKQHSESEKKALVEIANDIAESMGEGRMFSMKDNLSNLDRYILQNDPTGVYSEKIKAKYVPTKEESEAKETIKNYNALLKEGLAKQRKLSRPSFTEEEFEPQEYQQLGHNKQAPTLSTLLPRLTLPTTNLSDSALAS